MREATASAGNGKRRPSKALQPSGNHAQVQAVLHDFCRQNEIIGLGINVPRASHERLRRALQNRYAHRRHQPNAQEGQLETGSEQDLWIHDHQGERRCPNGVEHRLLAIEQPRSQIKSQHQRGPPDGCAQRGEQSISHHERNGDSARHKFADPQPPQKPERNQGKDAHIHPRNHQHVVSARTLEVRSGGTVDECVFADDHGVHQRGLVWRPQGVNFFDDAAMDSRTPEFQTAAREAGKYFDARSFGRGESDDSVFCKIALVVKCSRIAVIARKRNFGGKSQPLSVAKQSNGAAPRCCPTRSLTAADKY